MPSRSPQEIRASVQATRQELEYSIGDLESKVKQLANWRSQLVEHRTGVLVGAAVAGFVVGGGVAAVIGLVRR